MSSGVHNVCGRLGWWCGGVAADSNCAPKRRCLSGSVGLLPRRRAQAHSPTQDSSGSVRISRGLTPQPALASSCERPSSSGATTHRVEIGGRARAIGVSNFSPEHLRRLIDRTEVVPAVNQVELHPYLTQPGLREVYAELGTVTQAWSPIGGVLVYMPASGADASGPPTDPLITDLAAMYGKTPAQVILRWHLDNGLIAIPKSATPSRIRENIDVFDFTLAAEDMSALARFDSKAGRIGPDPDSFG
jgi:aryl-alcohol dehydrogenase-like predicted oxidoreductase